MEQVKVGVIGVGRMGQRHCRVFSNLRRAQLVGVCDAVPESGERIARQYGVPFFRGVDELLKHVDAVSLAVPTPLHFDLATACLTEGIHVLVEKPITETVAQAEALTRAAEASRLVVLLGHIERFNPTYIELKNILEDMTMLTVNVRRLGAYANSNNDVDVVLDLMIHDIDLVLDMIGQQPYSIAAHGLSAFSGNVDYAVAHLTYETGPLVEMTASRITEQKIRLIEATTRDAYIEGDLLNKSIAIHRGVTAEYLSHNRRGVKYRQESLVERIYVPTFEPLFLELQHFVECVIDGKLPQITARDGLDALCLAEKIRATIRECVVRATGMEESLSDHMAIPGLAQVP